MFTELITQTKESLNAGNVDLAKMLLDKAWEHAKAPDQRKLAHDMGNRIQRAIFSNYLEA